MSAARPLLTAFEEKLFPCSRPGRATAQAWEEEYLPGSKREFTAGKSTRPALIDASLSVISGMLRELLPSSEELSLSVEFDVTGCYAPQLGLQSVVRRVSLRASMVLVEDRIAPFSEDVEHYRHGRSAFAW